MKNILPSLVKKLIEKHGGGKPFFDELDMSLACTPYFRELNNLFIDYEVYKLNIICSGGFGHAYQAYMKDQFADLVICLPGGLREAKELCVDEYSYLFFDKKFIFVDDSLYSGNTYRVIQNAVRNAGGDVTRAFVIYDGSPDYNEDVISLYRYHGKLEYV